MELKLSTNNELETINKSILELVNGVFNIDMEVKIEKTLNQTEYFYYVDNEKIFSWGAKNKTKNTL